MNWKKLLLIGAAVIGFAFAPVAKSNAGLSVNIGLGYPSGYGYYGGGYGYYGGSRCYSSNFGYGYPYYGASYYRPVVYYSNNYRWYHGRRIYCRPRRHW